MAISVKAYVREYDTWAPLRGKSNQKPSNSNAIIFKNGKVFFDVYNFRKMIYSLQKL